MRTSLGLFNVAGRTVDENGVSMQGLLNALSSLPWAFEPTDERRANMKEVRFSFDVTSAQVDQMNAMWQSPTSVIAVGERAYDVSPYGAQDMLLNAAELYLSNPGSSMFRDSAYAYLAFNAIPDALFLKDSGFAPIHGLALGLYSYTHGGKLSRLFKQRLLPADKYGPVRPMPMEGIIINMNLSETVLMIQPFERWVIGISSSQTASGAYTNWIGDLIVSALQQGPQRRIMQTYPWASRLINYSREFGIPPATTVHCWRLQRM